MGAAMGIPDHFLLYYAGKAQIDDGTAKAEDIIYRLHVNVNTMYVRQVLVAPYGDYPRDRGWIKEGIKYYNQNKPDGDWW